MRKRFLQVIVFLPLLFLGAAKLPYINNGIYLVKQVNLDRQEFFSHDVSEVFLPANEARLVDSKPDELIVAPEFEKLKEVKFGSFKLGNNDNDIWFIMAKDPAGYYSQLYIDQNLDANITVKEKVSGFETFDYNSQGITAHMAIIQRNPIPVAVSYKGANGEIKKKVYFYLWTGIFKNNKEADIKVWLRTASVLEGLLSATAGKDQRLVKFRIMDSNSNGCFNDYGKDIIFMDLNYDSIFSKKETQPLNEFFDIKDGKQRKQFRFIVLPYPGKVQVAEATQEFDPQNLEPESDI